jgi:hypothetical protein
MLKSACPEALSFNVEDINIRGYKWNETMCCKIQSDSKLLFGFPFISHRDPDNNFELLFIFDFFSLTRSHARKSYVKTTSL